ncbi:MAG: hypothetical protein KBS68_03590 [Clostridiales bacterium]|nr:hypothetical protein [Candidatus Crickella merdequi]
MKNVTSNDYVEVVYTKDSGRQPATDDNSPLAMMFGLFLASCAGIYSLRKRSFR